MRVRWQRGMIKLNSNLRLGAKLSLVMKYSLLFYDLYSHLLLLVLFVKLCSPLLNWVNKIYDSVTVIANYLCFLFSFGHLHYWTVSFLNYCLSTIQVCEIVLLVLFDDPLLYKVSKKILFRNVAEFLLRGVWAIKMWAFWGVEHIYAISRCLVHVPNVSTLVWTPISPL